MRKKKDGWHTFNNGEALIAFLKKNEDEFYESNVGYFKVKYCCSGMIFSLNGTYYKMNKTMADEFANGLKFKHFTPTRTDYEEVPPWYWVNPEIEFTLSDYFATSGTVVDYRLEYLGSSNGT